MSLDFRAVVWGGALMMTACSADSYRLTGLAHLYGTRFAYFAANSSGVYLTRSAGELVGGWTVESIQIGRETVVLRSGENRFEIGFGRVIQEMDTSAHAEPSAPLSFEVLQQAQRNELAAQLIGRSAFLAEHPPGTAITASPAGSDSRPPSEAFPTPPGDTDGSSEAPSRPTSTRRPPQHFAPKPPTPDQIYRSRFGDDAYLEAVAQKRSLTEAP